MKLKLEIMGNYHLKINEGHITGFGVGPISNENTLIQFVIKISKKVNNGTRSFFTNYKSSVRKIKSRPDKMYIVDKKSVYL